MFDVIGAFILLFLFGSHLYLISQLWELHAHIEELSWRIISLEKRVIQTEDKK